MQKTGMTVIKLQLNTLTIYYVRYNFLNDFYKKKQVFDRTKIPIKSEYHSYNHECNHWRR